MRFIHLHIQTLFLRERLRNVAMEHIALASIDRAYARITVA